MLISLNWIKDFVKLPDMDENDLANSFTMTTAEVEEVKTTLQHLNVIKVAEIKSLRKHPEADKLNLVTFDFGGKDTKEVVCGAPNVREGLKIPYAPLGTTLPNGLTLEPKKIRGILSDGMLCSEVELGLGEGSSGLMELPPEAKNGTSMLEYLGLSADTIIDVDNKSLTHRPDLWGHYGLAREFAAAHEVDLAKPFTSDWEKTLEAKFSKDPSPIKPKVEADSSCLGYWGLSLDNVKVESSPQCMINRLEACGLRSINNIVDISNYVMLELGHPLHIFDRDLIEDNVIHIKTVGQETTFKTLDELDRKLIASDTVITDSNKALVLAGIMGGLNSGVSDSTSKVFIEVANWKADEVRKTSTRLGLRTDSSQRFEKSLDTLQCYRTLLRTLELILELCPDAKVIGKPEYDGDDLSLTKRLSINTSAQKINSVLGHEVSEDKIIDIFERLDFEVEKNAAELKVTLPTYRTTKDIEYEACLIEEIGRVVGYDNITPLSPMTDLQTTRLDTARSMHRKVQDFMTYHARSLEVMTYPLIGEKLLKKSLWPVLNEELVLINALSQDADRMRPSLIPHALNTVAINSKNYESFNFFEIGRSYLPDSKDFSKERYQIFIGSFHKKETPFMSVLNTTERLLKSLSIPYDFAADTGKFENPLMPKSWGGAHPYEQMNIRIMGKFHGVVNSAHPIVMKQFKAKGFFSFAVIDITDFHEREMKTKDKYTPISKFPASRFDCTVIVPSNQSAAATLDVLKKAKIKEMTDRHIVDVFELDSGDRAVTVSVLFEDPNKTLEPEFIKSSEDKVVKTLADGGFPLKS